MSGPIRAMLQAYSGRSPVRFHMPGHKGRAQWPGAAQDVTELTPTDNLLTPQAALQEAQELAAAAWKAQAARILVGGSSAGVHAMVLWSRLAGKRLVLPREMHISAVNACALYDVDPLWVWPEYDAEELLPRCPSFQDFGGEDAILTVYPDYYGRCCDLEAVRRENPGAAVLCDAAHGAHFVFDPQRLPLDAGAAGADAWTVGAHKTLPAPTQSAYLLVNRSEMAADMERIVPLITTTSPSYLLMAGLDDARDYMQTHPCELERQAQRCFDFAQKCLRETSVRCLGEDWAKAAGFARKDPLRLVLDVSDTGLTGWQVSNLLEEADIYAEMADARRVVCITSPLDETADYEALLSALVALPKGQPRRLPTLGADKPEKVMTPHQALLAPCQWVGVEQAAGRIAARPLGAYPPGWPVCVGGERIAPAAVDALNMAQWMGGHVFGMAEDKICVVK
ncbi:MAG: hypothetical protein PHD32_01440 [Eubacteriales bacterium]|nr:hypothetical protein [Eubacteriales bacterium]